MDLSITWNADAPSTWYYLFVNDSTGNRIKQWYSTAQAGCAAGTGTCLVSPDTFLAQGSGQWWVHTWNQNGTGPWSDPLWFSISGYSISGTVTSGSSGLSGVTINLSGAATKSTTTDTSGNYSFSGLSAGRYTVTPSKTNCTFMPLDTTEIIDVADRTGVDFTGTCKGQEEYYIYYSLRKKVGTDSSCQPRDLLDESEGELPVAGGTIPISYSETWEGGFATMTGSVSISRIGNPDNPNDAKYKVDVTASFSNQGLGCCRNTGITFTSGSCEGDSKGCFENGSTSASASCTDYPGSISPIGVWGKQAKIIVFAVKKREVK